MAARGKSIREDAERAIPVQLIGRNRGRNLVEIGHVAHDQRPVGREHGGEGDRTGAVVSYWIREGPVRKNAKHIDLIGCGLRDNQELSAGAQNSIRRRSG